MKGLYNEEAEAATVAGAMLNPKTIPILVGMLTPESFVNPANQHVFRAVKELYREGAAVDLLTVAVELKSKNLLKSVGGDDYLVQICDNLPSARVDSVETYARLVVDCQRRRVMRERALAVAKRAEHGDDADEVQVDAARIVQGVSRGLQMGNLPDVEVGDHDETGVTTGFPQIDEYTGVGYVNGQTCFVAAARKDGKTSFMTDSAIRVARQGIAVGYATFADLDPMRLKRRMLKQLCGMGGRPTVRLDMVPEYEEALAVLNDPHLDVKIYYGREHGRNVEDFGAAIRSSQYKEPRKVWFVDYVQRIGSRAVQPKDGNTARLEYVSGYLAELADDLGIPLVIGSQITKEKDGTWKTKYATALEEDAGLVLRLSKNDATLEGECEIYLNRFGITGTVPMKWDQRRVQYREAS